MKQQVRVGGSAKSSSKTRCIARNFFVVSLFPSLSFSFISLSRCHYFGQSVNFLYDCLCLVFSLFICPLSLCPQHPIYCKTVFFLYFCCFNLTFSICLILYFCQSSRLCFIYLSLFSLAFFYSDLFVDFPPCFSIFMFFLLLCFPLVLILPPFIFALSTQISEKERRKRERDRERERKNILRKMEKTRER